MLVKINKIFNSCHHFIIIIIIIIRQPLCPVVGRRPQHAISKLLCLVLSSAISCRSSICLGRLSTAWLVSLVVCSCHMVSNGDTRGPSVVFEAVDMPCPGPFHFSYSVDYIYDFCPLPDPDVGLSIFVCDVEHTSFYFSCTQYKTRRKPDTNFWRLPLYYICNIRIYLRIIHHCETGPNAT